MDNHVGDFDGLTIGQLSESCHRLAKKSGFWDDAPATLDSESSEQPFVAQRNYVALKLGLIISEISEALEELRKYPASDIRVVAGETYYPTSPHPELMGQNRLGDEDFGKYKPEGIAVELADAVIRALDLLGYLGWTPGDVEALFAEKLVYNQSRGYKHGKTC